MPVTVRPTNLTQSLQPSLATAITKNTVQPVISSPLSIANISKGKLLAAKLLYLHATQNELRQIFRDQGFSYVVDDMTEVNGTIIPGTQIDSYNISAPVTITEIDPFTGEHVENKIIAVRTEPKANEYDSLVMFYKQQGNHYVLCKDKVFALQDPHLTKIGTEIVLAGVRVGRDTNNHVTYRQAFFKGKTIASLEEFAEGPIGMKDVRLVDLKDKGIGVFTRPQGKVSETVDGGRGKIGFTIIPALMNQTTGKTYLTEEVILHAKIIEYMFAPNEWGGGNDAHLREDGKIDLWMHVAKMSDRDAANYPKGEKEYYPAYALLAVDYETKTAQLITMKIIGEATDIEDYQTHHAKTPNLVKVVFPGGIEKLADGTVRLYGGVGDALPFTGTITHPVPVQ